MEKWKELLQKAREIASKAEEEERNLTGEERNQIAKLLEEAKDAKEKDQAAQKDAAIRERIELFSAAFEEDAPSAGRPGKGGTLGQQFVGSEELKTWMARVAPSGRVPDSAKGLMSPPVEFKRLLKFGRKDLITGESDTSAGAFVEVDYTGIYEPLGRYALSVLDMISRRTTTSDLVEFVRQTRRVQEAAPTEEANVTEYGGATGEVSGKKPEGTLELEPVQEPVRTIAVWIPATKRALSDAAQIRGIIDDELRDDLEEELENQIVNGDGVGENFTGILHAANTLAQAWDTDILTTTRRAITTVQVAGRATPTAWVLHPVDWEIIELQTDDTGRYYYAGPRQRGPQTLWGIPVVTSQSLEQGTGLLGDFRKAVLWDREAASIQVSDSHEDFFIRNLVAILAEMRAAFGLIRPSAFCEVDLTIGS